MRRNINKPLALDVSDCPDVVSSGHHKLLVQSPACTASVKTKHGMHTVDHSMLTQCKSVTLKMHECASVCNMQLLSKQLNDCMQCLHTGTELNVINQGISEAMSLWALKLNAHVNMQFGSKVNYHSG